MLISHPKISVVMPVFNRSEYLAEAIDSVLHQTFTNFELIIVNDFSTDNSRAIVERYSKVDGRIRVIQNEKNMGIATSRNIGTSAAKGEFIAIMDSDDIAYPSRLEKQYDYLFKNTDVGFCGTWIEFFGETNKKVWKTPLSSDEIHCGMVFTMCVANPTVMFRRSLIEDNQLMLDPKFKIASDYEFWARALEYTKAGNIGEILLRYRVHPQQVSNEARNELANTRLDVQSRFLHKIGVSFTEEELYLHNLLCTYDQTDRSGLLPSVESWLLKLLQVNDQNSIFSKAYFQKEISQRWTDFIFSCHVTCKGLAIVYFSRLKPGGGGSKFKRLYFLLKWFYRDLKRYIR